MAKRTLTAAAVRQHRPYKYARREVPDAGCPGLRLIIQPTGHKSWALRFRRPGGRTAKLTLGPVDFSGHEADADPVPGTPLTLAGARRLAAEVHRQRARGLDVVADHGVAKRRAHFEHATRAANTFAVAARDFVEQHAMRKQRRWQATARMLGLDPNNDLAVTPHGLCDRWADTPVTAVTAHDIYMLVDEAKRLGVPGLERRSDGPTEGLARAMHAVLSALFGWLVRHRRVAQNPCAGVHRPGGARARDRVLDDTEIAKFWAATARVRPPYGAALRLLLLTGCRREEVAGMRRAELSKDLATWTIPATRTKNKLPHVVALPPAARACIAAQTGGGDYVFSTNGGMRPVSAWAQAKQQLDQAIGAVPHFVLHDLRRTAATGMANIGVAPHIVEACLNHVSGAKAAVAGVYNRAAYLPEKRAALERWAAHIGGLTAGRRAKVVALRRGKP